MIVEKRDLWDTENPANYIMYLQDNSPDINRDRKHPALIICGGGAYLGITDREKEPVALRFLNHGFQCFVLNYNTHTTGCAIYPTPLLDLAKMVLTIREHAAEWNIAADQLAAVGFSAGGHLCACMATEWHEPWLAEKLGTDSEHIRLNAAVLCYPFVDYLYQREAMKKDPNIDVLPVSMPQPKTETMALFEEVSVGRDRSKTNLRRVSPVYHVTADTCPCFIWHTWSDELVYAGHSLCLAQKLYEHHVPCELHLFPTGCHGLSLANEQSDYQGQYLDNDVAQWPELSVKFLKRMLGRT